MMHTETARAARRGDEPGPIAVVQRVVAPDVTEPVELRRSLQRHHDVVVGDLVPRAAASAAEHAVTGREVVEVQRLGAITTRRRRTDREAERKTLSGSDERGRADDPLAREVVRRSELVVRTK